MSIVDDIVSSQKFYCETLGFKMAEAWEPIGKFAWCWLQHGDANLMLQQSCSEDLPASARAKDVEFFLVFEDAGVIYHEIMRLGAKATKPLEAFYGMKQTSLDDPDGYKLCLQHRVENA